MLKTHEKVFQLKQTTKSREKMLQPMKKCILWEMGLKLQNLSFNSMENSIMEQAKDQTWDQTILVLNSKEKVKRDFLLSLMCMFPELNETEFWSHRLHLQNSGILQIRMDERRTPWKWILAIFKYKNEYHRQLELKN